MNSRERVMAGLPLKEPGRVPFADDWGVQYHLFHTRDGLCDQKHLCHDPCGKKAWHIPVRSGLSTCRSIKIIKDAS